MKNVYERLARRLDQLPDGYPATDTGVELKILRKIFTPEDAEMALKLKYSPETADSIAERLDEPVKEIRTTLDLMAEKGQISSSTKKGVRYQWLLKNMIRQNGRRRYTSQIFLKSKIR